MDFGSLFQARGAGRAGATHDAPEVPSWTLVEQAGQLVYNEEAFRHFLFLERARAQASGRSFLFVMVSLARHGSRAAHVPGPVAAPLFAGLAMCVREIDFIGWYREGRIAGAVLAQGSDTPTADVPRVVGERVTATLRQHLPPRLADRLRVRVLTVRGRTSA